MKKLFNIEQFIFILVFTLIINGCKKFMEIPPPQNQLISNTVFESESTATAALNGIYSEMMNNSQQFSSGFTTFFAGLSADEFNYFGPSFRDEFINNKISIINHDFISSAFWGRAYQYIYAANLCIESIESSKSLSPQIKSTLIAEAKFIRAFCYYYLINLFGDVPLVLYTKFEANSLLARTDKNEIYKQIVLDLIDGINNLSATYQMGEIIRPTKWTASALLSRVYLHLEQWVKVEELASSIINSGLFALIPNLDQVFLKNSKEAIWQLAPVNPNFNTWEGNAILSSGTGAPTFILTPNLINSFDTNDKRLKAWIASRTYANQKIFYPFKYKLDRNVGGVKEYYMVFRLAEMYLNRAEAKAQQNNLTSSLADLNFIRQRAGLPDTTSINKENLLALIFKERRKELFAEWGHRWFDLNRWGRADEVLGSLKPEWKPTSKLWPIPTPQINLNPSLTQNPGY